MRFKANKKIKIFFENIKFYHYPSLKYYLYMGYEVAVFDFNYNLKKQKWLRNLINNGRIERIFVVQVDKLHGFAIDQTEIIFKRLRDKNLLRLAAELYQSDEIYLVFKKRLLKEIFQCMYINNYFTNLEKISGGYEKQFYFIPEHYKIYEKMLIQNGNYDLSSFRKIQSIKLFQIVSRFVLIYEKIKYALISVIYAIICLSCIAIGKLFNGTLKSKYYEFAIPIDQIFQIKFKGPRKFDFLLDHEKINLRNTIFILNIPLDKVWIRSYEQRGCVFFKNYEVYSFFRMIKSNCQLSSIINAVKLAPIILKYLNAPLPFIYIFFLCIRMYIRWKLVFNHINFKDYIYTNQESPSQMILNILIRLQGGNTWMYSSFLGGGYLRSNSNDFNNRRNINWAFLNFDYFLGMNNDVIDYYKLHYQHVKKYHSVGCFYSEMVKKTLKIVNKRDIISNHFEKKLLNSKMKIISFFDTTFIDSEYAPTTFQDCIEFYQDILKLLSLNENILITIKPSKSESWFIKPDTQWASPVKGKEIINLWEILRSNHRVFWAGDAGDIVTIMAISDLVVTHCMSSPTAEALGARKKAIWYESGNKHCGLLYDKIPGLIMHGYKELEKRIKYLLYDITDDEYNRYLDKYIKGKVEHQLDGLALTRFRHLLLSNKNI